MIKPDNAQAFTDKFAFAPRCSCNPGGVPGFAVLLGRASRSPRVDEAREREVDHCGNYARSYHDVGDQVIGEFGGKRVDR